VLDRCANGQQPKRPTVTDEFTKKGLAINVEGRIHPPHMIEVLSRLVRERSAPTFLPATMASEFVQAALVLDCAQGIGTVLIERDKPVRMASRRCRTSAPFKCRPTILDMRLRRGCMHR